MKRRNKQKNKNKPKVAYMDGAVWVANWKGAGHIRWSQRLKQIQKKIDTVPTLTPPKTTRRPHSA